MKKSLLAFFSLVALFGIVNCVVIEPAFAHKEKAAHSEQAGDSDCCFIHCSLHHQWVSSNSSAFFYNTSSLEEYVPLAHTFHLDSPAGSIFHPPLAI